MKKIFSFIFLPLMLASCVNLDYFRSDTLTSAALATNPAAAVYTTDGIYSMLKDRVAYNGSSSGNNTFPRQYFLLSEVRADNICFSNTSTDAFWDAASYVDGNDASGANYLWMLMYKMLYAANANIDGMSEGASLSSDYLLGENYFLRAFAHFTLCRYFAKPYTFNPDNPGIVLRMGVASYVKTERATVGKCYEAIEGDLKKAIELMGKEGTVKRGKDNGYASKEAAQGLLSRVYLYMGEYDKCIEVCNELLGADPAAHLEAEVTDLYSNAPSSKEVLWCIDITNADVVDPKSNLASMYDSTDGTQNTGWGELYVADPFLDLMERFPQDKRYKDLVRLYDSKPGLCVTWGVEDEVNKCYTTALTYPNVGAGGVLTSSVTDNGDGTYSFTKDGKSYKASPDNTANKVCDDFPGYILDDAAKTRCYVRNVMPSPTIDPDTGDVTWELHSIRNSYPTWFCNKFSNQTGSIWPITSSIILLRYGEIILNRAEAYAHKGGKDAEALADVNIMRTRAGLTGAAQMTAANMAGRGYSKVLDVVLDERRLELYYEGERLFDLLRNEIDIDRRYPSRAVYEVIPYTSGKIQYQIPRDETSVSGIPENNRD